MSKSDEWTAQRLSDYADGYEFARQEILEQGEEIEWCEPHDSASHRPDGVSFRCDVWVAALAADGVEPFEPCRMVPSLRIPLSALRIADPGEEE